MGGRGRREEEGGMECKRRARGAVERGANKERDPKRVDGRKVNEIRSKRKISIVSTGLQDDKIRQ